VPSSGTPDIYATYIGEGINGSVVVSRTTSGIRSFHSAGKVQASSEPRDMRLQRLLGHISALAVDQAGIRARRRLRRRRDCGHLRPAPRHPAHRHLRHRAACAEFVAPQFHQENYGVVTDPRTQVIADDGRHFIRTTKEKFDVITSDPWTRGSRAAPRSTPSSIYEMCKQHLKPGGVMTLWLPLYETDAAP